MPDGHSTLQHALPFSLIRKGRRAAPRTCARRDGKRLSPASSQHPSEPGDPLENRDKCSCECSWPEERKVLRPQTTFFLDHRTSTHRRIGAGHREKQEDVHIPLPSAAPSPS